MKPLFIFIIVIVAWILPGYTKADSLDDAHGAFAAGHYHESTLGYQTVLAQKGYSAPVLFDLGNSYFREGDFAQAILAYKRAQWLSPDDRDIVANLQLAQKQAGVAVDESLWGDKISRVLNASSWAWIGSAAWTLLCVSLLARSIWPQRQTFFSLSGSAGALVLIVAIAAIVFTSDELHQSVVTTKNASALLSPFPDAQGVFSPPLGETLTAEKAYNDFVLVKDRAEHSGWISKTQVTPILSARPPEAAHSS